MKKYILTEELLNALVQIHGRMGLIEVKGDSVDHLFGSRYALKQVLESIKEIKEDEPKEGKPKEE